MDQLATLHEPWTDRRRRTAELREQYGFAGQVLRLYSALLDVQQDAFEAARANPPSPEAMIGFVTGRVLPKVVDATIAAGPEKLSTAVVGHFHGADLENLVGRWLRSEEQSLVDRYLARASTQPVLEAGGEQLGLACAGPRDRRHCPSCGGLPQLAYNALSGEPLVTGPRYLVCSRCQRSWQYPRLVCAGCGEDSAQQLITYSESEVLPHLTVEGCQSCSRYLISVDLRKQVLAVPAVDELAALPLDLHAKELGLRKVVPNLMGF